MAFRHYIVTGHPDGEYEDTTRYVKIDGDAKDAEDKFKDCMTSGDVEVFTTMVAEIPGPPLEIFTEHDSERSPDPI